MRAFFLVFRWSLCPHIAFLLIAESELSTLMLLIKAPPLRSHLILITSLDILSSNTMTPEVRIQHMNFEDTSIQSTPSAFSHVSSPYHMYFVY